jgi:hypothetical protein
MCARQPAHIVVLRPRGRAVKQNAANSKKCPASQRRDFFDEIKALRYRRALMGTIYVFCYCARYPPSTISELPVTHDDSSLAR